MSAALEVVAAGLGVSLQDAGRHGHRSIGVPLSGALDPVFLAAANGLAGNPPDTAGLEVLLAGPCLKALAGPLRIALAGEIGAQVLTASGIRRAVAAWSTATLHAGDLLLIGSPRGVGYVALAGGLLTAVQLGSRSTYLRAGLCPLPGVLPCAPFDGDPGVERRAAGPLAHDTGPIRAMAGPQIDHFGTASIETFFGETFTVTRQRDRMGLRLAGPRLAHNARGADIVSDGVTPGAVQVPADGHPIVLLADCQTVGGYPKIATVIRADLPRLAHLQSGETLRFRLVDAAEAAAARREQASRLDSWLAALRAWRPGGGMDPAELDAASLLTANLAGTAVRGDETEFEA